MAAGSPANLFGLPSACVPAGRDAVTGLPIDVLLTGRRMCDGECLDAAEGIESRLGLKTPIDPVLAKVVRDGGAAMRDAGYEVVDGRNCPSRSVSMSPRPKMSQRHRK